MFDVAVAGSLHLDIMIHGSPIPATDETVFGESWGFKCGGKGGNQAKAAARFGARTQFIGRVGEDDFGTRLIEDLKQAAIDVSGITLDPRHGSGMSAAIVGHDGSYGATVVSGANRYIREDDLKPLSARVLLLQNEVPEAINLAAARIAKARGAMIVVNAAPWRALPLGLVQLTDILVLNRIEAAQSGGLDRRPDLRLVLTKGAEGLEISDLGVRTEIAPHPVRQISSHGAGDLFCGALAARLSQGDDLATAARFANAAAALFVSRPEGRAISEADVRALL
jgi:ribokinase